MMYLYVLDTPHMCVYNYVGFLQWCMSFGIINSFEFDQCQVLKMKIKAECVGDMILPYAVAKE